MRVRTRDRVQFHFDVGELVGQDRLEQLNLAWEMRIERFFANA